MKVSVLTPVYRTDERFLREAIESVLSQTFSDFEFLLLDDCPEDSREALITSYRDPRIVYVKNERNLGISASRNKLIDLAKGEYLAVFDHDDLCRPERFAHQVAYMDAHPECGVLAGWTQPTGGGVNVYPQEDHAIKLAMMQGISMWHPASMIRASVLRETGARYESAYTPVEDYMLWMRLLPKTIFHNLPEVLIDYRWHASNTSVVRKKELDAQDRRVKAWAKINLPELYAEYELSRETIVRARFFGLPILKITQSLRKAEVRLFGLPLLKIARTFRV